MYPLSVLLKSPVAERKSAAESLMNTLREHSSGLVEEALMVSSELIRVAILWLETWHEGLEDASRLYFVEGNVAGMLDILLPLHEKVEAGAETFLEKDFLKNFGQVCALIVVIFVLLLLLRFSRFLFCITDAPCFLLVLFLFFPTKSTC